MEHKTAAGSGRRAEMAGETDTGGETGRMWCVLYGRDGDEEKTEDFVRRVLPEQSYSRCVHPVQHKMMRHGGQWRDVLFSLLPGYVLIETDDPDAVYQILKRTPKRPLFCSDEFVSVLSGEEEALLDGIMDEDGQIGLSVVRVAGSGGDGRKRLEYLSGPLGNVAGRVTRVNLHRRIARVETGLAGERKWINLDFRFEDDEVVSAEP